MKLSILICTVPQREEMLNDLLSHLSSQRTSKVQIIWNQEMNITTGEKRNWLINMAKGDYTVFIDDDDWVPEYYVNEILQAIETKPDCVGMRGYMTTNGATRENFEIKLGHPFKLINGIYLRYPNHISPIKREIAELVKFPHKSNQEDYAWSTEIKNRNLLKTEVFIDRDMYHYRYSTQNKLY